MIIPLYVVVPAAILALVSLAGLSKMRQIRAAPSLSNVSFPDGWTPPPELTGPLPRKTRLSNDGMATALVATVFLLVFMAFAARTAIHAAKQKAQMEALGREGLPATGEVKRLWYSGLLMTTPWVRYTFTANGAAFTGASSVPEDLRRGLREADPMPIRFLPSNPAVNRPAACDGLGDPDWWVLPCVFLFIPFTAFIVTRAMIPFRQDRQLAAEGVPAAGVVVKCYGGGRGGWMTNYQFRTQDGGVAEGRGACPNRSEIGSTVCVLYLPQNSRRNHLYSTLMYRVAQ